MPTLLLADDSDATQRVVELTLSGEDIRIERVTDGEQAVSRVAAGRPDIVLAEITLPARSGYDVCAFIREQPHLTGVPVLLLAGAFEAIDQERARRVRCDGILVKPFDPQQVVARVRELLRGASGAGSPVIDGVPRPVERLAQRVTPVVPSPANQEARVKDSVDEYFERLDAAFTNRLVAPTAAPPEGDAASTNQADTDHAAANADADVDVPTLDRVLTGPSPDAAIGEDVIEEISRRVLQRIDLDLIARAVNQSIEETTQRLVREEIDRRQNPDPRSHSPNSPNLHIPDGDAD